MLSIRMIKLCGNSICKPLSIIFNDCLNKGKFPHEWKKANVVPVHKKGNKQSFKNYRPISLLPICSKIFERLIYNEMFTFLLRTIWSLQINQDLGLGTLVLTNYLLLPTKYVNRLMRSLKLEGFSKAFDKVWHEDLLLKLDQNGISGNLLNLLHDFLSCRKQRVVLIISHLRKWFA